MPSSRSVPVLAGLLSLLPLAAGAQQELRAGQTVSGTLEASDATLDDGTYYDEWVYMGRRGETVLITLRSDAFDTVLLVARMDSDEVEPTDVEFDDDSGGGTDSELTYTFPDDGRYVVLANSVVQGETGPYTLTVAAAAASAPAPERPATEIQLGQTAPGALEASDGKLGDGSYFDLWSYRGRQGEQIRVTMRSAEFDAYLAVVESVTGRHKTLEEDDDSAGGSDAQVTFTLPVDGVFLIRANSLFRGEIGGYTLTVEPVTR